MLTEVRERRRRSLLLCLSAVILAGLGSRQVHTGFLLSDKYMGDALYAVMVYLLLAFCRCGAAPLRLGVLTMIIMTALELFQLTGMPLRMTSNGSLLLHGIGRLMGTVFGWPDLVAYAAGVFAALCADYWLTGKEPEGHST